MGVDVFLVLEPVPLSKSHPRLSDLTFSVSMSNSVLDGSSLIADFTVNLRFLVFRCSQ